MGESNSFVFYKTTYNTILKLPQSERRKFFEWICEYGFYHALPADASPLELAALTPIFEGIDRAQARYNKSRENGGKGGRPNFFSEQQKQDILKEYNGGMTQKDIATKYGCDQSTISRLCNMQNLNININDNINTDNDINDSEHSSECRLAHTPKNIFDFYKSHDELIITPKEFWEYNEKCGWKDKNGKRIINWQGAYINMNAHKIAQYKAIGRKLPIHDGGIVFDVSDF